MAEQINPAEQTSQFTGESGVRFDRAWFAREQKAGIHPADRTWMVYSDHLVAFEGSIDPGVEPVHGLGTPDPVHFSSTVEENEIMLTYSLQRPVVDAQGDPLDACADAFLRDQANQIPNTHSAVFRDENLSPGPDDPDGCMGQRQYLVMKGAKADVTMEPDSEEAQPTPVELTYTPEKARSYHFYQPAADEALVVSSSSANDTTQDVTIEDEGGSTSTTVTLDGTNLVHVAGPFSDVDAVELSAETEGDVTVAINTGSETSPTEGGVITVIRGAAYYADDEGVIEGDLGVPALEGAAAPGPIGDAFEDFHGDRVERPAGARLAPDVNNITVEVDNDLDPRARQDSTRIRVPEGNREISISAELIGEKSSHEHIEDALAQEGLDIEWELSRSLFVFPNATITGDLSRERESDDTFADQEVEFSSKGVQITQV